MVNIRKDNLEQRITRAVVVPKSIPLEYTPAQYRAMVVSKVMRKVNKGTTPEKAFHMVTGYTIKKGEKINGRTGRHRKKNSVSSTMVISILAVLALILGGVAGGLFFLGSKYSPNQVSALSGKKTMDNIDPYNEDTTILFTGVDSRPAKDAGYGNSKDVPGKRSDIIALVKLHSDSDDIDIVSIPRDTSVDVTPCEPDDGIEMVSGTREKINGVNEEHGQDCLTKIVENMSGVTVDAYVEIDFKGFTSLIDSVGGVTVNTDGPVVDDTLGKIIPRAGEHKLSGIQALNYARARKVQGTGKSDLDRIKRQQEVVESLVEKFSKGDSLSTIDMVSTLISNVSPNMSVDGISRSDMFTLAKKMSNTKASNIHSKTLPIIGDDNFGNLVYDEKESEKLFKKVFFESK